MIILYLLLEAVAAFINVHSLFHLEFHPVHLSIRTLLFTILYIYMLKIPYSEK